MKGESSAAASVGAASAAEPARWARALLVLAVLASPLYAQRDAYVFRDVGITHDNIKVAAADHVAVDALRHGTLPLWSPEMNGGEPLWPELELWPWADPVPLAAHAIAPLFGGTMVTAQLYTLFLWLMAFAAGAYLLARALALGFWASLLVLALVVQSSFAVVLLKQGNGLMLHARWLPLVLVLALRVRRAPTRSGAAVLGTLAGLATASYQTMYALTFVALLAAFSRRRGPGVDRGALRRCLPFALATFVATTAPTLVAAAEWPWLVPMGRIAQPAGWRGELMRDVIDPLLGRAGSEAVLYVGGLGLALAAWSFVTSLARLGDRELAARARPWAWTALVLTPLYLGVTESLTGRDRPLLTMRNWHFFMPYLVLTLAMLAGFTLRQMQDALARRTRVAALAPVLAFGVVLLVLAQTVPWAERNCLRYGFMRYTALRAREPRLPGPPAVFTDFKRAAFPDLDYAPYNKLGGAVWHIRAAFSDPERIPFAAAGHPGARVTHMFRPVRYEALLHGVPPDTFLRLAGVTRPVLRLFTHAVEARDDAEALAALARTAAAGHLDDTVVIEGRVPDWAKAAPPHADEAAGADAQPVMAAPHVVAYGPNRVRVRVTAAAPAILYYADGYDERWSATVDGAGAPVWPADLAWKAVPVPAGSHEVELVYRPTAYLLALALRVLGLAAAAALAGAAALRARRRRGAPPPSVEAHGL